VAQARGMAVDRDYGCAARNVKGYRSIVTQLGVCKRFVSAMAVWGTAMRLLTP
jgi:hypothetical protein